MGHFWKAPKASGLTLCLLVNFQKSTVEWRRIVLAFQNPEVFCNHSIVPTDPDPAYRFLPSFSDPPQHMKYRHLMNRWFAPAAVKEFAPAIQLLARETIEPLVAANGNSFEIVGVDSVENHARWKRTNRTREVVTHRRRIGDRQVRSTR